MARNSPKSDATLMHTHTPITGLQYVGGRWVASNLRNFVSRNPASRDEFVGVFPAASAAEVQQAIIAAADAAPGWAAAPGVKRVERLRRLGELIRREADRLAELCARETGRPISECRAEADLAARLASDARPPAPDGRPESPAGLEMTANSHPVGVVAVLTPWTFPLALPVAMTVVPLVAGNAVVLKPSEDAPAVGQRLVELCAEVGFPPGVVNLLHGDGFVGEALLRSPRVDGVLFAGQADTGRRVRQLCAEVTGRSSAVFTAGKATLIVCRDADLDRAVAAATRSAYASAGQRCDSAGRILVDEELLDPFIDAFVESAQRLRIGDPLDRETTVGPLINESAAEAVHERQVLARREGAEVLLEGTRLGGSPYSNGCYVAPFACCLRAKRGQRTTREEVPGPFVTVTPFRDLDEAVRLQREASASDVVAVFAEDYRTMRELRRGCRARAGFVNAESLGEMAFLPPEGEMARAVTRTASWATG